MEKKMATIRIIGICPEPLASTCCQFLSWALGGDSGIQFKILGRTNEALGFKIKVSGLRIEVLSFGVCALLSIKGSGLMRTARHQSLPNKSRPIPGGLRAPDAPPNPEPEVTEHLDTRQLHLSYSL